MHIRTSSALGQWCTRWWREKVFLGDTMASTLAAILKDSPRPTSKLVDGLPREMERLIVRCMRKEVNQRSQHMDNV